MATLDDAVGAALSALTKSGVDSPDVDLLRSITKALGPSVYSADSKNVSCSDPDEVARVGTNFVEKKLGVADGAASVQAVCEQMKGAGAHKHRAAFYYLLVKHHGKESVYA
ncbi:MAG TPA: DUF2853 family protein [Bacteroidetes bacterium]|nr:DUF2853 family protein [Bacteroidota bacterium]HIL58123.1 DUF2853 family protein [Rhodothermales bacterium]